MKKAFTVCFSENADSIDTNSDGPDGCDDADDDLDDSVLWEELNEEAEQKMYIWV